MDILSLGLAGKAKKMAEENERRVGLMTEGRFRTVDSRLAYLENQAAGLLVDIVRQIDKTSTYLSDVVIEGSTFKLMPTASGFKKAGVIETGVVDLGEGLHEVNSILVEEEKTAGQYVTVYAAYSSDDVTWSGYAPLPLASVPSVRYWKLKIELSVDVAGEIIATKNIGEMTGLVVDGLSELSGTEVKSMNTEIHPMTGQTVDETSTLYSVTFEKPTLGKIGTVTLKEG
ncbi:hypothetical protein ACQR3P_29500 [Rhodococcus sp. IEGM1300]